jgi:hypothetical protein
MISRKAFWLFAVVSIAMAATDRRANALWMKTATQKWPNGVVPVCMTAASVNHPNAALLRGYLEQVAAFYSNVARIKFVSKLPACAGKPFDAANVCPSPLPQGTLVIDYSGGAFNSVVGYHPNVATVSQMDPDTPASSARAVGQEIGHALGFEHEQDRTENIGGSLCSSGVSIPNQQVPQDHLRTSFDRQSVMSYCRSIGGMQFTQQDVLGLKMAYGSRVSVGYFKDGTWWLDNGDNQPLPGGEDQVRFFGQAGDFPVVMREVSAGACGNPGHSRLAVYRGSGLWYVDNNQSGFFGLVGDRPFAGVFGGSPSFDQMGVFRNSEWYLDANTSGYWDTGDVAAFGFGLPGDIPIVGAWDYPTSWLGPPSPSHIGVFHGAGEWYLDKNGNNAWDDVVYNFGGTGDWPIVGDWNGDGRSKIGVYRDGMWYLDFNGDGLWTPNSDFGDMAFYFGITGPPEHRTGTIPIVGDWF